MKKLMIAVCAAAWVAAQGWAGDGGSAAIERAVAEAGAEIDARQGRLTDRCRLTDYAADAADGVWTRALQRAVNEHEIVVIPPRAEPYLIDAPVLVPSNRRIEAKGARIRLKDGTRTLMLRNANVPDGTLAPVTGTRDDNIAVVGGTWEDCQTRRLGYGRSGMFNLETRGVGNHYGVSTLFLFGNCDHVSVEDAVFVHCAAFAVQAGDGDAYRFRRIRFDRCFADGLHLNGNLSRVLCGDVRGQVGDDLVALNAYDWLNSSVNFGPQRNILCEDLELVPLKGHPVYPAIRIQPAKYRYRDGTVVDCAINDVIFRRVKGIMTFKMYLQTPAYQVGGTREWAEVGSGGNLYFEDITIDLARPIDMLGGYKDSDPVRGHFGAFEFGANLTDVHFRNIDITFHCDKYPLSHLAVVGPKSCRAFGTPECPREVFDPYVNCTVDRFTCRGVRASGVVPKELVHVTVFDDVNCDGASSGRGTVKEFDFGAD